MQIFSDLIYLFLINDLNVVLSIFLAAGLICRTMPKKKVVIGRMAVMFLLSFLWSALTNIILYRVSWPVDPYEEILPSVMIVMIIKYLVCFSLTFLGIWFCIQCSGYTLLYCATLSYCVQHIGEKAWEFIEGSFVDLSDLPRMAVKYGCILLVYVLLWIMVLRRCSYVDEELMRRNRTVLYVALVVIFLDIVLGAFSIGVFISNSNRVKLVDNAYSLLANMLVLFSVTNLIRVAATQQELTVVKQVQQEREKQYIRDQETQDALNVKCHDLKYQLSLLEDKMDTGELSQIRQIVEDYDTSIQTGQPALDVILSNKWLVCNGKQITFTEQVDGKALNFMSEVDIYTMFGNMLDNAIEAVEGLSDTQARIISLTVQNKGNLVFIHEENYFSGGG